MVTENTTPAALVYRECWLISVADDDPECMAA